MIDHEIYMRAAIDAAEQADDKDGVAIGAVLVDKAGVIVARGGSMVGVTHDPTAHAEINCIRMAAKKMQSDDLYEFTLYSTLEPCHMCLSAAAWARIPQIFFGAYRKDVDSTLFDIRGDFSDEKEGRRMNLRERTRMKVIGGIRESECTALLAGYHERQKHS